MLFNSIIFLIFFPIVTLIYFLLPHKFRWAWLLLVSIFFYMTFIPVYILILALLIVIDYSAGIFIEKSSGNKRTLFLLLSILSTCMVLVIFKYFNFLNMNIEALANFLDWNYSPKILGILLPIGLSFHTFQSLSYVIEVYRKKQKAERNFGIYSLYVMFYPQLVAGPIERPYNMLHQFYEKHKFESKRVSEGLLLMLWGFFKKVVIADRLAILVDVVYNNPSNYSGFPLILATVFFAFQIYCDFSGYSDIAIGAARVMGFSLMTNFRRPYYSKSIGEFWRRWHISLSTWFRDYVYIPIGGSRVSVPRWYFNLFIVFLVSGLWHGASWTFVLWGALHGIYMIFSVMTSQIRKKFVKLTKLNLFPKIHSFFQILITFILVCLGWVFFRAENLDDVYYILTHFFSDFSFNILNIPLGLDIYDLIIAFFSILIMEFVQIIQEHKGIGKFLSARPSWFRWSLYLALILWILLFGVFINKEFIYFQF